jgi:hypothetical protein
MDHFVTNTLCGEACCCIEKVVPAFGTIHMCDILRFVTLAQQRLQGKSVVLTITAIYDVLVALVLGMAGVRLDAWALPIQFPARHRQDCCQQMPVPKVSHPWNDPTHSRCDA